MAYISVPFETSVLDVNLRDGAGNPITSQVSGSQRALDVGINVAGVQVDPRSIRALTNADVVTVEQGTSPWVVSGTVNAAQSGTWNINNITGTISLPTGAATETTLDSFYQLHKSATATRTTVSASTSSVSLLGSNSARKQLILYNHSASVAYVNFGATASSSAFTVRMTGNSTFILDNNPIYTGQLSAIWTLAVGDMQVTEMT